LGQNYEKPLIPEDFDERLRSGRVDSLDFSLEKTEQSNRFFA
jgi:hypothetical protein